MTLLLDGRLGVQQPRVESKPQGIKGSSGPEAVEFGQACGMDLDVWQAGFLDLAMSERADGSWAASEAGLIASRQNGKNGAIEVREGFGLTILHEWIIHTSHLFKTTRESYDRLLALIEANPDVKDCLVSAVASPASGYEMKFRGGGRITFIARSRSSGRGLTGDLLIFDEAQDLNDDAQGALLPTISARPGAQAWYLGSAPDIGSVVFHRVRKRGRSGEDPRLAYMEFSAEPDADPDDRDAWAQANPALGIRITEEAVESERRSMSAEMFLRERLSISPDVSDFGVFTREAWDAVCDPDTKAVATMFAFDVNPERSAAAIVAVGKGPTVEVVDYLPGVAWLADRIVELRDKYKAPFAVDKMGPAGAFVDELTRRHVRLVQLDSRDMVAASALFYDAVLDRGLKIRRHRDLDAAVIGAAKRPVGDAWAWGRKTSSIDISLLVAASVGVWAAGRAGKPKVLSMAALMEQLDEET